MAITNCIACNKKISDKAATCSHCGASQKGISSEDSQRKNKYNRFLKMQKLNTQSFIATILFMAGIAYLHWGDTAPTEKEYYVAMGVSGIGFTWYIVNRARMIILKKMR